MREVLSILLLGLATLTGAQNIPTTTTSTPKVTLDIPETISSDKIDIRYFMSGPFGGYGGFVRPQHNLHSYEIEAAVEGKPAKGIKIIMYSPGCAFKTYGFRFDNIQEPHATYICDPLPQVTLQGQVSPSSVLVGHQAIVKVWYMANWDHQFFGIMDGMVQQFEIAQAALDSDGNFSANLPDFTADPRTSESGPNHPGLLLTLVDQKTLNPIADRLVCTECEPFGISLKIQAAYPKLVIEAVRNNFPPTPK